MENMIKIMAGIGGSAASFLWGGWSSILIALFVLVVLDYLTGVITAFVHKKLSSKIGLMGITRKIFIFIVVAVAHWLDMILGMDHILRDGTILFYAANEVLSIFENCGSLGLHIPKKIQDAVLLWQDKEQSNHKKGKWNK